MRHVKSEVSVHALQVWVGIATLVLALLYLGHMLGRGWIPHDEGLLAQSAERVLNGQIPHRDFDEPYTGGLTYLNAAAFLIWGVNLMSMRFMLFVFFAAWVPTFYYCATRILSPISAGAVTLAAVAWGPPNYAAALPSWYNLFFATAITAAVFRFLEVRLSAWLFIAGLLAGISFLFKSVALYSIASVFLFLLFYESTEAGAQVAGTKTHSKPHFTLVIGVLGLFGAAILGTLFGRDSACRK